MQTITSLTAPVAIGPYSQAIKANGMIFCSGQIPLDPQSMEIVLGGIKEQTEQVIKNIIEVLTQAGSSLDKVIKAEVFLDDINDFTQMNEVYAKYFVVHKPARTTLEVAKIPKGAKVEIAVIALE